MGRPASSPLADQAFRHAYGESLGHPRIITVQSMRKIRVSALGWSLQDARTAEKNAGLSSHTNVAFSHTGFEISDLASALCTRVCTAPSFYSYGEGSVVLLLGIAARYDAYDETCARWQRPCGVENGSPTSPNMYSFRTGEGIGFR